MLWVCNDYRLEYNSWDLFKVLFNHYRGGYDLFVHLLWVQEQKRINSCKVGYQFSKRNKSLLVGKEIPRKIQFITNGYDEAVSKYKNKGRLVVRRG